MTLACIDMERETTVYDSVDPTGHEARDASTLVRHIPHVPLHPIFTTSLSPLSSTLHASFSLNGSVSTAPGEIDLAAPPSHERTNPTDMNGSSVDTRPSRPVDAGFHKAQVAQKSNDRSSVTRVPAIDIRSLFASSASKKPLRRVVADLFAARRSTDARQVNTDLHATVPTHLERTIPGPTQVPPLPTTPRHSSDTRTQANTGARQDHTPQQGASPSISAPCKLLPFCLTDDAATAKLKGRFDRIMEACFHLSPNSYRPHQLEAMVAAREGKNIVVRLPTGAGKSLCYLVPALAFGRTNASDDVPLTVVITPTVALIQDQLEKLWNFKALGLVNGQGAEEQAQTMALLPEACLLYITPERLGSDEGPVRAALRARRNNGSLVRFVIDEAHCIAEYGASGFRQHYSQLLTDLRENWAGIPVTIMSATLTEATLQATLADLGLAKAYEFRSTLNRPNLHLHVRRKKKGYMKDMLTFVARQIADGNTCGLIYELSQSGCDNLARSLRQHGISAYCYHADLPPEEKDQVQSSWQEGKINVIVATSAFGLGVDKADVRFVIHHCLPRTVESYWQEVGRAGRDGKESQCILYFDHEDVSKWIRLGNGDGRPLLERERDSLGKVKNYAVNKTACRRALVLQHFGEELPNAADCNAHCDNCLGRNQDSVVLMDATGHAQEMIRLLQEYERRERHVSITELVARLHDPSSQGAQKNAPHPPGKTVISKKYLEDIAEQLLDIGALDWQHRRRKERNTAYPTASTELAERVLEGEIQIYVPAQTVRLPAPVVRKRGRPRKEESNPKSPKRRRVNEGEVGVSDDSESEDAPSDEEDEEE